MNFIDKLVFPKPKSAIPLDFEDEVIFVPALKEPNSYHILREVVMKTYSDLVRESKLKCGSDLQEKKIKSNLAEPFHRENGENCLPSQKGGNIESGNSSIHLPERYSTRGINTSFLPDILINIDQTLDFTEKKKSAFNNLNVDFDKRLAIVSRDKSRTLEDTNKLSMNNDGVKTVGDFDIDLKEEMKSNFIECNDIHTSKSKIPLDRHSNDNVSTLHGIRELQGKYLSSEYLLSNIDLKVLKNQFTHGIPCLYLPNPKTRMIVVYFHSNAEDITMLVGLCECIRDYLNCGVIAMEYAGYCMYSEVPTSSVNICSDAENLIHFLYKTLELKPEEVLIMGRSIGSGPALHIASKFVFSMVVIIAGFLSIQAVVKDRLSILGKFVGHYFNNENKVQLNKSPLLILHGKNDDITSSRHSEVLYEKAQSKSKIVIFDDMPHNNFDFLTCVVVPIREFQKSLKTTQSMLRQVSETESESARLSNDVIWNLHSIMTNTFFS
jgi:hypothetical protein